MLASHEGDASNRTNVVGLIMSQRAIPFMQLRGGSSKGVYFLAEDLPDDKAVRDEVLKHVMGAYGDPRQIDGMGGGETLTSKIGIIGPSSVADCDVDYSFIQAIIGEDRLDETPNCGNILAGVGAFALETGLVTRDGTQADIKVHMTNSGNRCTLRFPIADGKAVYGGDARIDGVMGTAAPVMCIYENLAGSACGQLLPTGQLVDRIDGVAVTCIDNGMAVVALRAEDFGLNGDESPDDLNANQDLKARLESIRLQVGPKMGLGDVSCKAVPKMCLIAPAANSGCFNTRTFIPKVCHQAIGVLGAVSAASAVCLAGSAVHDIGNIPEGAQKLMAIEHPSGVIDVELGFTDGEITSAGLLRTTRLIAKGEVFIPSSIWP